MGSFPSFLDYWYDSPSLDGFWSTCPSWKLWWNSEKHSVLDIEYPAWGQAVAASLSREGWGWGGEGGAGVGSSWE